MFKKAINGFQLAWIFKLQDIETFNKKLHGVTEARCSCYLDGLCIDLHVVLAIDFKKRGCRHFKSSQRILDGGVFLKENLCISSASA
jgi:hypothetical protein